MLTHKVNAASTNIYHQYEEIPTRIRTWFEAQNEWFEEFYYEHA